MNEYKYFSLKYGDMQMVPKAEEPKKSKFSIKRSSELASAVWTIILRATLISSVVAMLIVTGSEVVRDTIVVEEIGLPKPLVDMGYSGTVAAHRLWDSVQWISDHSGTSKERASLTTASRQLQITEPETGLSLSGLVQMIRRLIGREQPRIAGEFACSEVDCSIENMELRLRVFLDGSMKTVGVGKLGEIKSQEVIDNYFDRAALALLKIVDPYVRATFLYGIEKQQMPEEMKNRATALVASLTPIRSKHSRRSIAEVHELLERGHIQRSWAALLIALDHFDSQEFSVAANWSARSVELMRTDRVTLFPNAYYSWGVALLRLRKYQEAIDKFRAAILIDDHYTLAHIGFGNALVGIGNPVKAIERFKIALRIKPDSALANNGWGNALASLGDKSGAIEKYEAALEIDPELALAYSGWGSVLGSVGKEIEAIEKYQLALEINPEFALAHYGLGNVLAAHRKSDEAIKKYKIALAFDPDLALAYNAWGNVLFSLLKSSEAIKKYQMALEIDPNLASAFNGWGNVLVRLGNATEAVNKYQAALDIDPGYAVAYNGLGYALARLGQRDEAVDKFKEALDIDPTYEYAFNNWLDLVEKIVGDEGANACAHLETIQRFADKERRRSLIEDRFSAVKNECLAKTDS